VSESEREILIEFVCLMYRSVQEFAVNPTGKKIDRRFSSFKYSNPTFDRIVRDRNTRTNGDTTSTTTTTTTSSSPSGVGDALSPRTNGTDSIDEAADGHKRSKKKRSSRSRSEASDGSDSLRTPRKSRRAAGEDAAGSSTNNSPVSQANGTTPQLSPRSHPGSPPESDADSDSDDAKVALGPRKPQSAKRMKQRRIIPDD
jgi:hypothetical protein